MSGQNDGRTLFIRNIPQSADDESFANFCSEFGSLERAFIVKGRNGGQSRGFGFATYLLEDDAIAAAGVMGRRVFRGARLNAEMAVKKGEKPQRSAAPKPVAAAATNAPATAAVETKPSEAEEEQKATCALAARTVVVFGFPASFNIQQLRKRIRKLGKVSKLRWPIMLAGSENIASAEVTFEKLEPARTAVAKMDKHTVAGFQIFVRRKNHILNDARAAQTARIIVRNLPFDVKPIHLRNAFGKVGPITDIKIPVTAPIDDGKHKKQNTTMEQSVGESGEGESEAEGSESEAEGSGSEDTELPAEPESRAKGFAFIQFVSKPDAAAAIAEVNGKKVRRRVVAVDFALQKKTYANAMAQAQAEAKEESDGAEEGSDSDDAASEDSDDAGSDGSASGSESGSHDSDASSVDGDESIDKDEREAQEAKQLELETTVFVRNVSFDTTETELKERFAEFGPVRYARIVIDRRIQKPKGVAFVRFKYASSCEAAIKIANATNPETLQKAALAAPADAAKAAVATDTDSAVPAAVLHFREGSKLAAAYARAVAENGVKLGGRILLLTSTLRKAEAEKLSAADDKTKSKFDKRHLYLAHEGAITGGSEVAANMPLSDLQKRERAQRDKKQKLKAPLFFVSPTRLSVRNLSRTVEEKELKQVFHDAAVEGMKQRIVHKQEGDPALRPPKGTKPEVAVIRVNIMQERLDRTSKKQLSDDLKPKSKGFGFVEFSEHIHALAALRILNNNPDYSYMAVGGKQNMKREVAKRARLMVEFTVENIAKMKIRQQRHEGKQVKMQQMKELAALEQAEAAAFGMSAPAHNAKAAKPALQKKLAAADTRGAPTARPTGQRSGHKPDGPTRKPIVAAPKRKRNTKADRGVDVEMDVVAEEVERISKRQATQHPQDRSVRRRARKREHQEEQDHDRMVAQHLAK